MTSDELTNFAKRYTEAWCSQDPEKVAVFYAKDGKISVNDGQPTAIAEVARGLESYFSLESVFGFPVCSCSE